MNSKAKSMKEALPKASDFNPAAAFISASESRQDAPEGGQAQEHREEPKGASEPARKAREAKTRYLHVMVQPSLYETFRAKADAQGLTMNGVIADLIKEWTEK